jgi:methylmalonyl-CoA/ethylmalonyl-CoA epimerase
LDEIQKEVRVTDDGQAARPSAVLDHVAVGTDTLTDGWELFGGLLGGAWAYGGDSPGFWWGQLSFSAGPKVELLTPTGGHHSRFLERFLAERGPGVHHLNFIVPAIEITLGKIRSLGIEPVRTRLEDPRWKEAFLHPRDAYGTVIQVAEQAGQPPSSRPPAGLGEPGHACSFSLVELDVADIDGATRLFEDALDGEVTSRKDAADGTTVDVRWPNDAMLQLRESVSSRTAEQRSGGVTQLQFSRGDGSFGPAEVEVAAALARRLGLPIRLS